LRLLALVRRRHPVFTFSARAWFFDGPRKAEWKRVKNGRGICFATVASLQNQEECTAVKALSSLRFQQKLPFRDVVSRADFLEALGYLEFRALVNSDWKAVARRWPFQVGKPSWTRS
jgi:hypothetical protein